MSIHDYLKMDLENGKISFFRRENTQTKDIGCRAIQSIRLTKFSFFPLEMLTFLLYVS